MTTSKTLRHWVFGAATAAALGFGGTQALAAPAPAAAERKVCDPEVCDRACDLINRGFGGFCTSAGTCVCWR